MIWSFSLAFFISTTFLPLASGFFLFSDFLPLAFFYSFDFFLFSHHLAFGLPTSLDMLTIYFPFLCSSLGVTKSPGEQIQKAKLRFSLCLGWSLIILIKLHRQRENKVSVCYNPELKPADYDFCPGLSAWKYRKSISWSILDTFSFTCPVPLQNQYRNYPKSPSALPYSDAKLCCCLIAVTIDHVD